MKDFVDLAKEAAGHLEETYANEPELEFLAWLRIALQREAMVSQAYDATFVDSHLEVWSHDRGIPPDVIAVIRRALMGVWAQETAHQAYFAAVLGEVNPPKTLIGRIEVQIEEMRGKLEGKILGSLISKDVLRRRMAQLAIVMGTHIEAVPEYVQSLRQKKFSEFCHINADLEHTAVLGYRRMLTLAERIRDTAIIAETAVLEDVKRTKNDERYHEGLFRELSDWPPGHGAADTENDAPPSISRITVDVENARLLIAVARKGAYGSKGMSLGDSVVEVDPEKISEDAFIGHMRRFVRGEEEENEQLRAV
jgi:hypothetical protein